MELDWWTAADGRRVPHTVLGEGDRAVVALPGLTDGLLPLVEDEARALLRRLPVGDLPFRLRMLSYPDPLAPDTSTEDLAALAAAWIEAVARPPVVLVGHSMGGMVAQHLAATRPDLIERLVLTATLARPDDVFRDRLRHWTALLEAGDWRAYAVDALRVSFTGSSLLRRLVAQRVVGAAEAPERLPRHRALTHACCTHDAVDRLADIVAPTLVLGGAADPLVRPERVRDLAAGITDATVDVLPRLGHGFPEQARRRVFRRIADFAAIDHRLPGGSP